MLELHLCFQEVSPVVKACCELWVVSSKISLLNLDGSHVQVICLVVLPLPGHVWSEAVPEDNIYIPFFPSALHHLKWTMTLKHPVSNQTYGAGFATNKHSLPRNIYAFNTGSASSSFPWEANMFQVQQYTANKQFNSAFSALNNAKKASRHRTRNQNHLPWLEFNIKGRLVLCSSSF